MSLIHIVDDDVDLSLVLKNLFKSRGYSVKAFNSGKEALPVIMRDRPDIVVLDVHLPEMNGITILEKVKEFDAEIEAIMITGYADVDAAVKAIKLGARDYIKKPIAFEELNLIVKNTLEVRKKSDQLNYMRREQQDAVGEIIGTDEKMRKVFYFIDQVSNSPKTSVLITGETGTGKGIVSRTIHYRSPRAKNSFIEVNCSAFQPSLLESELFGYEAGAFTGAKKRKRGLFELANEGTLFLDEIGDMSFELQAKILKVVEEQSFRRVGGTEKISVDTRIISASSRNLQKAMDQNQFRRDLFYRLNVASIELPPLRERGKDIILIADHYREKFSREMGKKIDSIADDTQQALLEHNWVGNIRELRNVIERAVLFEQGDSLSIDGLDFLAGGKRRPPDKTTSDQAITIDFGESGISLSLVEKQLIEHALEITGGNQTRAAKLLDLSRETLKYRIKKFGIGN